METIYVPEKEVKRMIREMKAFKELVGKDVSKKCRFELIVRIAA